LNFVSRQIDPARLSAATYPYRLEIATQFTDLDIVGHLNNVAIARFYESARVRTNMRVFGENFVRPDNPLQMVLADVHIRYLAEGHFPEPVTVGNGIGHVGNSSFRMQQALFQHGACIGISDAVLVVTVGGKPTPIPAVQRAAMQDLRMPPAQH
jgi:acyl-CoA thioester hydrolase